MSRQKYFYSHLVDINSIAGELEGLQITESEKEELLDIAHIHLHQTIIDAILQELTESDKKKFLELVAHGEDDKVWNHLNEKVEKIEDKITKAAKQTKIELKKDIEKIREK